MSHVRVVYKGLLVRSLGQGHRVAMEHHHVQHGRVSSLLLEKRLLLLLLLGGNFVEHLHVK